MPNIFGLILTCVIVVIVFSLLLFLIKRYKKCPSDKVMVIYGKVGSNKDGSTRSAKCIHGGAAFIWPVIQSYEFLDLTPMSISVDLENALSRQNIRINVPSRFTVGVSTEPGVMQNAAERLLGLFLGGQGYLSHRFAIAGAANLCGTAPAGYQLAVDILTKVIGWKGIHKFVPLFLAVNVDLGNGLVQLLLLLNG